MMMKGTREIGDREETGLWTIYPSGFGMGVFWNMWLFGTTINGN